MFFISGGASLNGIYSRDIYPGAKHFQASIMFNDSLVMFGGIGYTTNNHGYLNDLWVFDPIGVQWYFTIGSILINQMSVYQGNESPSSRLSSTLNFFSNS